MAHQHVAIERLTTVSGYTGPVNTLEENPAAHGNVQYTETCQCGARRSRLVNGRHEEIGAWDLPEWIADANPDACAAGPDYCRRVLVSLADSRLGRRAIEAAGYGAILGAPDRGDDESTITVARAVWSHFRRHGQPVLG